MAVGLIPWLAGCESARNATLTGKLWDNFAIDHREPAGNANLRLFHTSDQKDVLVRYDEERESNGTINQRAFLLMANEERMNAGKKPLFLSVHRAAKIEALPLATISSIDSNSINKEDLQAIIAPDGHQFTLVSHGREIGSYYLPTYSTAGNKFAVAVLLPAAVAGDVTVFGTIFGAYAGACVLHGMAQNGGTSYSFRP